MLNVENVQRVAKALSLPVSQFFERSAAHQDERNESFITCPEEKSLLKHFKQLESNLDRLAVVQVARRLAAKR